MTTPHLDARIAERRSRRKRIAIGAGVIVVVAVVFIALAVRQAGQWGVPGFRFTNERGSRCVNTLTGHTCDPMTREDLESSADITLPAEAQVRTAVYTRSGTWSVHARVLLPKPIAHEYWKQLKEQFGPCVEHAPSTLRSEPDLTKFCVMNGTGLKDAPTDRRWTVATAIEPSGDTIAQFDIRQL